MTKYLILTVYTYDTGEIEVMNPYETKESLSKDVFIEFMKRNSAVMLGVLIKQFDIYVYEDGIRVDHISKSWKAVCKKTL